MAEDEARTHRRWMALLADVVRPGAQKHRGRVVKSTGDGVLAEFRHHAGRSRSEPTAADAATKLAPGAGLIVALLLSLGLWGAIWLTVSRFASLWN
jgi:class 3 adenylate cyclase